MDLRSSSVRKARFVPASLFASMSTRHSGFLLTVFWKIVIPMNAAVKMTSASRSTCFVVVPVPRIESPVFHTIAVSSSSRTWTRTAGLDVPPDVVGVGV